MEHNTITGSDFMNIFAVDSIQGAVKKSWKSSNKNLQVININYKKHSVKLAGL